MARHLNPRVPDPPGGQPGAPPQAPLGGSRAEAIRRLQIGAIGVVGVLLLIGLASIIKERAVQTETTSVAGAAPTSEPPSETAAADPLAEAGVVPDIPDSPAADPSAQPSAAVSDAATAVPVEGDR